MKKTVIIGASPNPERYSYMAAQMLKKYGHEFIPVGVKRGELFGQPILNIDQLPRLDGIDTVTLYVSERNQNGLDQNILKMNPKRVIFNPGTENADFEDVLEKNGIEVVEACTLVMLRTGQY
jgi:predicted CoA-binding protein